MWLSCCFVLGFSVVFVALGASVSLLGQWLMTYRQEANLVAGLVLIIMGIMVLTGQMTWFATWMLSTFPVLGRLG